MVDVIIMASAQVRRDWLQFALQDRSDIRVSGVSSTFPFLRSLMNERIPDLAVVDLEVTASDSNTTQDWIQELLDVAPIIFLSPSPDPATFNRLVRTSGGGMLRADATADQIVSAVHAASAGLIALDASLIPESESSGELLEELTSRETEVLQLLAEGFANREIANRLEISEHTIKFHIRSILGKLNASTRTEAVTRGFRAGLIDL
jgi:two-component system, NarL family, response regulator YdfI